MITKHEAAKIRMVALQDFSVKLCDSIDKHKSLGGGIDMARVLMDVAAWVLAERQKCQPQDRTPWGQA